MKLQESLFKLYSVYYAIVNYIFSGLAPLHGCLSEISEYMLDFSQDYGSDLITGLIFCFLASLPLYHMQVSASRYLLVHYGMRGTHLSVK